MPENNIIVPKIHTVFMYITERCNLDCTYCYFWCKKDKDLNTELITRLFDMFGRNLGMPKAFELSGGEALIKWDLVKWTIQTIRTRFPGTSISIQTNGLLLSADKIAFIRHHKVLLEIGIDGQMDTTARWRKNIGEKGFEKLTQNIRACIQAGIPLSCTMTVHPAEAERMVESFQFLTDLGINRIDVTPAAFMPWNEERMEVFRREYLKIVSSLQRAGRIFMGEDDDIIREETIDLSLHPPGYLLCGDPFLCLPLEKKEEYSIANMETGELNYSRLDFFYKAFAEEWGGRTVHTYREYVCNGFNVANKIMGQEFINTTKINPLMRFLNKTHLVTRESIRRSRSKTGAQLV